MSSQTSTPSTFIEILRASAAAVPNNAALLAPGRPDLTYTALLKHVEHTVGVLNGYGLKPGSRILILIPNGPELAAALLAVGSGFAAVMLNPDYKEEEIEFYLRQSKAEALIVAQGVNTPARSVAQANGIRVIELILSPEMPAGWFELEGGEFIEPTFAGAKEIGFFLATSGTTGRSKLVPYVVKRYIESLLLAGVTRNQPATPTEPRLILNVMPLFHLFGLANLIRPMMYGWGVVCGRTFNVKDFFNYVDTYGTAWACIAPAMMKMLVDEAPAYADIIGRYALRNIATAAAPLTAELAAAVEATLHVGILQVYGMTEIPDIAISLTALEGFYKPNSVGKAMIETAIMADDDSLLPANEVGEIVIHAADIFMGYEDNPEASAATYRQGWFCTGDMGYFDEEGFLFIKGRLKEIINRGGEKVSPYDVEAVLTRHPGIQEAAAFGIPHALLGEDVAAAVVVSDPALTSRQVRAFAAQHLAPQHVPSVVVIVSEIPKTAVGKPQRRALPELLGLNSLDKQTGTGRHPLAPPPAPPRTDAERELVAIWSDVLHIPEIGIHDEFFALGGTSLMAAQLVMKVDRQFHVTVPISALYEASTVAEMAALLSHEDEVAPVSSLLPIQVGGDKVPLFCVPGIAGQILSFRALAIHLGVDQPVYGLQMPGSDGRTPTIAQVETLAAHFAEGIREVQAQGPYQVIGHSFGGLVALEIARNLKAQGEEVALLGILDTSLRFLYPRANTMIEQAKPQPSFRLGVYKLRRRLWRYVTRRTTSVAQLPSKVGQKRGVLPPYLEAIKTTNKSATTTYRPQPYSGNVVYFSVRQSRAPRKAQFFEGAWQQIAPGGLEICDVPGTHTSMIAEPNVQVLAEKLKTHLASAEPVQAPIRLEVSP